MNSDSPKLRRLRSLKIAYVGLLSTYGIIFLLPLLFIAFQNFLERRNIESEFRLTEVPPFFYGILALWMVPAFWLIVRTTIRYYSEKSAVR